MITKRTMYRLIDDASKENILKYIKEFKHIEKIKRNNFEYFINFLKNDNLCAQYICTRSEEKAKVFLLKLANCFKLKNINITELYEFIKCNGGLSPTRMSDWNKNEILLINELSNDVKIKCEFAEFKYANKWGYETNQSTCKIVYNDENILWIETAGYGPQYFVLKNGKIYGLKYDHKYLTIYENVAKIFSGMGYTMDFDEIIKQYKEADICIRQNSIDLSECFYKGFFYKGILWDRNWDREKKMSIIKEVSFTNGKLKIEIENITYPHTGYILMDIENNKIIEAGKN